MTKEDFLQLTKQTVLLDGATGSNLMLAGMPKGVCTEQWILEHKTVILELQKAYVEAGSRILYAPTFGANRISLAMHGLEDQIGTINHTLVAYAREAADGRAYIAGDITTTGQMHSQSGGLSYEQIYDVYCEQISHLVQAGVDLLVAETMINIDETLAAVDAAASVCDLPVLCTMSVEADGSIFSGGNIFEGAAALESAGASAVGVNCSLGPDQLESVIRNLAELVQVPVIAKPNAGIPRISPEGIAVYDMDAVTFASHMQTLIQAGATLVGGCCGTTPEYISEIRKHL